MTFYVYIGIGFILISGGVFTGILTYRKGRKKTKHHYIDALHMLLEDRKEEALAYLQKTVKEDTENIMAYIKLGDLFRERENPIRAAKIHQNLLVRSELTESQRTSILHHLVLDYKDANALDKATEMAERLVNRSRKNLDNQSLLLSLYEEKEDWDKAFLHRQNMNRLVKKKDQTILALYRVQSGLRCQADGAGREARIRFREAIKLNKKCIPAYLYWGDSYRKEGRSEDAYRIWREFVLANPVWAHLAFGRLREVLFDIGRYGEIEDIYLQTLQKSPDNTTALLHLAELYRNQGKLEEAIATCQKVSSEHPELAKAWFLLAQLYEQKGDDAGALELALEGLNRVVEKSVTFRCSTCGFDSAEPLWHCTECGAWQSFLNDHNK